MTSISAFWLALARLVKGKAARFRARRTRLEITMSDSGPVPRSHSPLVRLKLLRSMPGFLVTEQIPQPGRLFVVFFSYDLLQPPAELDHFRGNRRTRPGAA